jgi:intergrase/recombinase
VGSVVAAAADQKRSKFIKLAEGRTQAALSAIRKIGNLSNRRAYSYSEADIKKIMKVLRDAVTETERKFGSSSDQPDRFTLGGK